MLEPFFLSFNNPEFQTKSFWNPLCYHEERSIWKCEKSWKSKILLSKVLQIYWYPMIFVQTLKNVLTYFVRTSTFLSERVVTWYFAGMELRRYLIGKKIRETSSYNILSVLSRFHYRAFSRFYYLPMLLQYKTWFFNIWSNWILLIFHEILKCGTPRIFFPTTHHYKLVVLELQSSIIFSSGVEVRTKRVNRSKIKIQLNIGFWWKILILQQLNLA